MSGSFASSRPSTARLAWGILVFAGLVTGAVTGVRAFANRAPGVPLSIRFPSVVHLNPGAPVKILGVEVGRVHRVDLEVQGGESANPDSGTVVVHAYIQEDMATYLRMDFTAYLTTGSPLGEPYVALEPGHPDSQLWQTGALLVGQRPVSTRQLKAEGDEAGRNLDPVMGHLRTARQLVSERAPPLFDALESVRIEVRREMGVIAPRGRELQRDARAIATGAGDVLTDVGDAWGATTQDLRRVQGKLRRGTAGMQERLQDTMDEVSHNVGLWRVVGERARALEWGEESELGRVIGQVRDILHRSTTDRRYTLAAFGSDDEIQNDLKGFQMTLKRKFWRFVYPSEGCPPAH